jgi:hypothetical protein
MSSLQPDGEQPGVPGWTVPTRSSRPVLAQLLKIMTEQCAALQA